MNDTPEEPKSQGFWNLKALAWTPLVALGVAWIGLGLFYKAYTMPAASMQPTFMEGDYFFVALTQTVEPGDVVTFKLRDEPSVTYIKRLIAVGGDRVQMIGGRLHINGAPVTAVDEGVAPAHTCWNGAAARRVRETLPNGRDFLTYDCGQAGDLDETPVFLVPAGHFFFMGDNRDNSLDSRADVGFIPAGNVVGRAEVVVFAKDRGERPGRFFQQVK